MPSSSRWKCAVSVAVSPVLTPSVLGMDALFQRCSMPSSSFLRSPLSSAHQSLHSNTPGTELSDTEILFLPQHCRQVRSFLTPVLVPFFPICEWYFSVNIRVI